MRRIGALFVGFPSLEPLLSKRCSVVGDLVFQLSWSGWLRHVGIRAPAGDNRIGLSIA